MEANSFLIFFYLLGCIHHTFVGIYSIIGLDFSNVHDPRLLDMKLNSFRYLTTWNLVAQTLYFYLALIAEIMCAFNSKKINSMISVLKIIKGWFFCGIIFPSAFCVTTVFWTLNFLNTDYVLPPNYLLVLPVWMNHCIHTVIVLLPIIEIAFGELYLPRHFVTFTLATLFPVIYTIHMVTTRLILRTFMERFRSFILRNSLYIMFYRYTGRWLYGVMYYMDSIQQVFFILFTVVYFIFLALIGVLIVKRKKNLFILSDEEKSTLFVIHNKQKFKAY